MIYCEKRYLICTILFKKYIHKEQLFFKFGTNLKSIILYQRLYESINYFHSNASFMNKIGLLLLCQNKF